MRLNTDWFIEPVIDFETKKYLLLAYLQNKNNELISQKLCHSHDELVEKSLALEEVIKNKTNLENSLSREMESIDWNKLRLVYKQENHSTEKIDELMEIILYAFPKINACRLDFKEEIERIKNEIQLDVVGILPNYLKDGFIILDQPSGYYLFSYETQAVLDLQGEKRIIHQHISTYKNTLLHTPTSIKKDIVHGYKNTVVNPAVFILSYSTEIPVYETLLPLGSIALRKFVA